MNKITLQTKKRVGRPTTFGVKRRNVNMSDDDYAFYKKMGDGNISAGIRIIKEKYEILTAQ